jgi:hypothetical protein
VSARRRMSVASTIFVSAIAGVASYTHMREVAVATHQGALISLLLPLSVDGLILVATLALGDGRTSTVLARVAFVVGVTASLAANVAAADPSLAARVVSAWPSVAFLLSIEVLLRHRRRSGPLTMTPPGPATAVAVTGHDGVTAPSRTTAAGGRPTAKSKATPPPSRTSTAATAARITAARRRWPDATVVQIAAKAGVSESTARRYLADMPPPDDSTSTTPPSP